MKQWLGNEKHLGPSVARTASKWQTLLGAQEFHGYCHVSRAPRRGEASKSPEKNKIKRNKETDI